MTEFEHHSTVDPRTIVNPQFVALDHDSVLADITPVAFDLIDDSHGYTIEDVESWSWGVETFGTSRYLSALWHCWTLRPDDIEPCESGLPQSVNRLREDFVVDIVTAHPDHQGISEGKQQWLEDHSIPYDQFVPVTDGTSKAETSYGIFIDDKPKLVEQVSPEQLLFLRDQPWNRSVDTSEYDNVQRVESVAEAVEVLTDE